MIIYIYTCIHSICIIICIYIYHNDNNNNDTKINDTYIYIYSNNDNNNDNNNNIDKNVNIYIYTYFFIYLDLLNQMIGAFFSFVYFQPTPWGLETTQRDVFPCNVPQGEAIELV